MRKRRREADNRRNRVSSSFCSQPWGLPVHVFSWFTGLVLTLATFAFPATAASLTTIEKPTFEVQGQTFVCPVQTGSGRKALVEKAGLYQLPAGARRAINLGRDLNILRDNTIFVRAVDNLYTGANAVWIGDLRIEGPPAVLPAPAVQGVIGPGGRYRVRFRAEENRQHQSNLSKECAPNWYFGKEFDVIGERVQPDGSKIANRVSVTVKVTFPLPAPAEIRIGLNSNAPKGETNRLTVFLNGGELTSAEWDGTGYRVVKAPFDGSLLHNGSNLVELLGDNGYSKHLDFVEIEANASPALQDGRLVVSAEADCSNFSVPGATRIVDISEAGNDQDVPARKQGPDLVTTLRAGRLYYFTARVDPLTFGPGTRLDEPPVAGKKLIVVGPAPAERALTPFLEAKERQGLPAIFVPFETIRDVFNAGVYGPGGLQTLVDRFKPDYLLIASGSDRDCRRQSPAAKSADDFFPGVPSVFQHVEQLTITDDPYTLGQTVGVGRLPARSLEDLSAWVGKALNHVASDQTLLLSGRNYKEDFTSYQKQLLGIVPATFLPMEGVAEEQAVSALVHTMESGAGLVVYQGHGQSWELDRGTLKGKDGRRLPASSWLLATCNSAYFYAEYECYLRDWLFQPSGGCINAIGATSLARADMQNAFAHLFLQTLKKQPDLTWGRMLNFLKRNLPLDEELAKKPNLPRFVTGNVQEDRKSIDVMMLLGDPSARILPVNRRRADVRFTTTEPGGTMASPGVLTGELILEGAWSRETMAGLRLLWSSVTGGGVWREFPPPAPFAQGNNTIALETESAEISGGRVQIKLVERKAVLPEIVWLQTNVWQQSSRPNPPTVVVRRRYSQTREGFELICVARNWGTFAERKAVLTQFQIGRRSDQDGGEVQVLQDSGWSPGQSLSFAESKINGADAVRARVSREGAESGWSAWRPLKAVNASRQDSQDSQD